MAIGFFVILGAPSVVNAHGRDITVTGKVVEAVVDDTTGKVYVLLPEHKNATLPQSIKVGERVSVYGDEISKNGRLSLKVEGVK